MKKETVGTQRGGPDCAEVGKGRYNFHVSKVTEKVGSWFFGCRSQKCKSFARNVFLILWQARFWNATCHASHGQVEVAPNCTSREKYHVSKDGVQDLEHGEKNQVGSRSNVASCDTIWPATHVTHLLNFRNVGVWQRTPSRVG